MRCRLFYSKFNKIWEGGERKNNFSLKLVNLNRVSEIQREISRIKSVPNSPRYFHPFAPLSSSHNDRSKERSASSIQCDRPSLLEKSQLLNNTRLYSEKPSSFHTVSCFNSGQPNSGVESLDLILFPRITEPKLISCNYLAK